MTDKTDPTEQSPAPQEPLIAVRGLCKTYRTGEAVGGVPAADRIDLDITRGSITALTGPSGSGKSTLLQLIGALDRPDAGTIDVDGTRVTELRGRRLSGYRGSLGFVFQRFHLLPTLSALDNVLVPVLNLRTDYDRGARARELLEQVGLSGRESALPSQLSGGQQQRVAIARALINRPSVILADEPTGNLDSRTAEEVVDLLLSLRARYDTTLVIATHDPVLTARCDHVVHLVDGRVRTRGATEPGGTGG
ncbi:ABC transporter ATP-binding protein [Kitasatospora sp. NPDC002227]|uniref:ABC transporter ATP-binding protein n=1 Tax=Kitasatospora sp. NPDC002227 TaxID=3154773 RepID=UPI00331A4D82